MTATTATPRYFATRSAGRYRVFDRQSDDCVAVAVCASRAKAEEKAAKLNAELSPVAQAGHLLPALDVAVAVTAADAAGAEELAQAVADGAVSFDDAAAALLSGNGAALAAELSAPTNDEAEWLAHVNATDAQAQADADEAEMNRMVAEGERAEDERVAAEKAARDEALAPAPEAPEQPAVAAEVQSVRIPRKVAAHLTAGSYDAELRAVVAARPITKDGIRTVKLTAAQRAELLTAAVAAEAEARQGVKDGDLSAVSAVLAATSLQKRLAATL